ncbi:MULTISPECIES: TetR family transcriptional regulator [Microbulbifer]|uniref:TetR family transcriptional regulator n=1 Tax=Microbulbifer celer TaxID=435905 RepID=A0ABW3U9Z7_9GAMM|nr:MULTISPECIES: TetR family transcriptional regulator [Microbulbifer]UFN58831.1 TetR family transcriptional regulator [Microbulbifer celer]
MARRSKEEAQETREKILDAAIEVFHKHGVSRPSLTEVAKLAGVTRGAVYGHFENKADLFSALTSRIDLPDESLCQAELEDICDPLGELRNRWLSLYQNVATNHQWQLIFEVLLLRCELVPESGGIHQRCAEGHREGTRRLRKLVEGAVRMGQLPEDLDIRAAVPILHSSLFGLLHDWLMNPKDYDLAEVGERQVNAIIEMLRTSPSLRQGAIPA